MKKTAIIASGSLTHSALTKKSDIVFKDIEFTINFSTKEYKNDELSQKELFKTFRELKEIPKTSQPPYQELVDALENRLEHFENLVLVVPSRELSGTYQGCVSVLNDLKEKYGLNRIHMIEAPSISVSETFIVEELLKAIENNEEITQVVEKLQKIIGNTYAFPSDVEFLKLSGRVSGNQAIAINILKIRPIVLMEAYKKPDICAKGRGFKFILKFINKNILNPEGLDNIEKIYFSNIELEKDEHTQILDMFENANINFVVVEDAPAVVATHFGPNSFGIYIKTKV